MKRISLGFVVFLLLAAAAMPAAPRLEDAFRAPPAEARPWTYWFWSDGNVTREGVTADLEAMQRVGLGGVLIMDVDQDVPSGPVSFMTPAWHEMMAFAAAEAGRLGLQINLNNDAGWTGSGGPWIDGEHSMQKVVWSEARVRGPRQFDATLASPETVAGFYRDIGVLAFPTPAAESRSATEAGLTLHPSAADAPALDALVDGDRATGVALPPAGENKPAFVELRFAEPFTARALEVVPAPGASRVLCRLEASPDGRQFNEVVQLAPGGAPARFDAVRARWFRLVFTGPAAVASPIRINEIELSPVYRLEKAAAKSGLGLIASPEDPPATDEGAAVARASVVDLTAQFREGRLTWDVPPGDWTILRFGHTSTGKTNYPSPSAGKGLEADKLSRRAIDRHFDAFLGKVFQDTAAVGAKVLSTVHVDSWEVGYQNWTPGFRAAFQERRGYDPLPWLPAFTGRVVGDEALSERFLWDVRRTISELLNENYAGRLAERAHAAGRQFSVQAYRYGPFDCLSYAGRADLPIGEFWMTRDPLTQHPSVKTMTSAGHIYGKDVIAAEAFTASDALGRQRNHPYAMKAIGDAAFLAGINQFIFHRYSLQPWVDDRKPGMTMGPWGVEYERTATWWEQTKAWHEYLARCQYLLRQGRFVADLCYLQSEEGFNNPATPAEIRPAVPAGYDFDFCSDEVVRTRMRVENGRIVLPDGMSYRVLVLPAQRLMTPELLRKIRELVRAGAIVYGPPPWRSPSLAGYPECDEEVKRLVAELWVDCECDGDEKLERALGKGKVIWGPSLEQVLARLGMEPDFAHRPLQDPAGDRELGANAAAAPVRHVHRALPDRDVYFVANLGDSPARVVASFRSRGAVELWRPESGAIQPAAVYDHAGNRTQLPLDLGPRESVFVVLKHGAAGGDRWVAVRKDGATLLEAGAVELTAGAPGPAEAAEPPVGSFTMAAWVKPGGETALPREDFAGTGPYNISRNDALFPPPAHEVLGKLDAAGAGFAVGRNGVTVLEHGDHHFPATLVYPRAIDDWTHVAIVFDRGTPTLYLDGEPVRTGLKTLKTVRGGVGLRHGREVEPFAGERSEIRQIGRALDAEAVRDLMRTMPRTPVAREPSPTVVREPLPRPALAFESATRVRIAEPGHYEFLSPDGRTRAVEVTALPPPRALDGPWTLRFPAGGGAPAEARFPRLISWSEHEEFGVRHFSGTATYEKEFDVSAELIDAGDRFWLDLGDVQVIAEVTLNGRAFGTLWKPPFRVDVTPALRKGPNQLTIKVTNLWVNRLIGDEHLPPDREWRKVPRRGGWALKAYPEWFQRGERSPEGRITFTTWKHYDKDAPLLPSGLLGPVRLHAEIEKDLGGAP